MLAGGDKSEKVQKILLKNNQIQEIVYGGDYLYYDGDRCMYGTSYSYYNSCSLSELSYKEFMNEFKRKKTI